MSDDTGLTVRKIEQILRDPGCSKRFARAILAGGWKAAAGDRDTTDDAEAFVARLRDALKELSR